MRIFSQEQRGKTTAGVSHHHVSWSPPGTGGQGNSTPFSPYNVLEPAPSIRAWNAAFTGSFLDLWAVFLETANSHTVGASQACAGGDAKYDVRGGMHPTSIRRVSAQCCHGKAYSPCLSQGHAGRSCHQSRGAVLETNVLWVGGLGGSFGIPVPLSICLGGYPAFP